MEKATAVVVILLVYILGVIVKWAFKRYQSHKLFTRYGIPGPKPNFFCGNMYQIKTKPPNEVVTGWLKKYGDVYGFFMGEEPYLVVNDLEMLKQVLIKDFHVFRSRPSMTIDYSPINSSIINLKGQRWKYVRNCISPTFSSGKIKFMTQIIDKKVDAIISEVKKHAEKNEMFDMYKLFQTFTLSVIADCGFSMKTHFLEDPKDQFLSATREFFRYSQEKAIELVIMFPFLEKIMSFLFNYMAVGETVSLIVDHVSSAIKSREQNPNIKAIDLVQLMLEHRKNDESTPGMTDAEIIGNAFILLLAGYETTANALGFTLYLLMTHPEIQERLQREIDAVEDTSYNSIQNLQYLDQVLSESLRVLPPITGFITRVCEEEHRVGKYTIPKGVVVMAPIWDIHHNPDYYPDPWKFDPDRFSPERKGSIHSMAYMPFGVGQRNCIGSRLAKSEVKLILFKLLKEFTFMKCEKTDDPIHLRCPTVILCPANGVWLRAVPRN